MNRNPANSKSDFLNKWSAIEMKHCPAFVLNRFGENKIDALCQAKINDSWEYVVSDERATKNYNFCKVPNSKAEDYKYRQLISPLGQMVCSIRFMSGNLSKPFVYIVHKDFSLSNPQDIKLIGSLLKSEYKLFKPQRIQWYSSEVDSSLIESNNFIKGDMVNVCHFIDELKLMPLPQKYSLVSLSTGKNVDWYPIYVDTYAEIKKSWSNFEEMVQVESKEKIQDLIDKNLLFEVLIQGEWAGVIAVDYGTDGFMDGYVVYEEFLTSKFRGQKYASSVQRHLIEALPSDNNQMLYGTIHYDNLPSIKTALACGRKSIGVYLLADI